MFEELADRYDAWYDSVTALIEDLPDLLIESCQSELPDGPSIHH